MNSTDTLAQALRALNEAAHAAAKAAQQNATQPGVELHTLRFIRSETDRLVDALPASPRVYDAMDEKWRETA